MIANHHRKMLAASGISDDRAKARGYETVNDKGRLIDVGIAQAGRRVPGLLVPQLRADGSTWGYQYRPDVPRTNKDGREIKYETPVGQYNGIDIPPGVGEKVGDPTVPLFITEGVKKADAAAERGLCCIALPGVWSWRGKNEAGGKTAVGDWHDIALNDRRVILAFDGDVARKQSVRQALSALGDYLRSKGARIEYLHLPDTDYKTGLDDYLVEHTVEELWRLVKPLPPESNDSPVANATPAGPEPVPNGTPAESVPNGAELLDDVESFLRRFLALPGEHCYVGVTLWAVHTHFIKRLETTPRLACLSPEPGSGKTRVLEVLDVLCANPLMALDISMAAFFRIVEDRQPTILLDEVDAIFIGKKQSEGSEDMRRVINNGYRVGAVVQRVGGKNRDEVQDFHVFTPVAMAGLGNLPDTLMSRSVIIRMKRRRSGEAVQQFRDRLHRPEGEKLQAQIAAWAASISGDLDYPTLPDGVEDRDADVWEPLIMMADLAGGDWPQRARKACSKFLTEKPDSAVSLGVRLLADLKRIWPEDSATMSTSDILTKLAELDEAPWADLYGEGLKPRKLAQLLSDYDIKSLDVWTLHGSRKGYRREDLWDSWQRYIPPEKGDVRDVRDVGEGSLADLADLADSQGTSDQPESGETALLPGTAPEGPPRTNVRPLVTGPGRCAECGFHVPTMGHRNPCLANRDGGAA